MARKTPEAGATGRTSGPTGAELSPEVPTFRLGAKEVTFTHLDRVYYPHPGYTKAEVLEYYLKVAPYLLPHLRERPLTLERWPEGVEDGSFFQKNASSYFPSWLRTFPVERKDHQKIVHYPVVEDEADLLYLVNQGTITFHTQMSRADDPEHPDIMVLDVDPPEDQAAEAGTAAAESGPAGPAADRVGATASKPATPFRRAVEVAFLLREQLREAELEPVVKTSGKRGLHLAFPLAGDQDYEAARTWLEELFADLEARHPALLTTQIRKNKRGGRVYLDALRMSPGATIVPPYVARPTPEATVSMPITWEELEVLSDGRGFTIKTAPARLEGTGDLWASLVSRRGEARSRPDPGRERRKA
jgi:bifunctional non-homologous end joining protein LigD